MRHSRRGWADGWRGLDKRHRAEPWGGPLNASCDLQGGVGLGPATLRGRLFQRLRCVPGA